MFVVLVVAVAAQAKAVVIPDVLVTQSATACWKAALASVSALVPKQTAAMRAGALPRNDFCDMTPAGLDATPGSSLPFRDKLAGCHGCGKREAV